MGFGAIRVFPLALSEKSSAGPSQSAAKTAVDALEAESSQH
jgi:hypothetical protein